MEAQQHQLTRVGDVEAGDPPGVKTIAIGEKRLAPWTHGQHHAGGGPIQQLPQTEAQHRPPQQEPLPVLGPSPLDQPGPLLRCQQLGQPGQGRNDARIAAIDQEQLGRSQRRRVEPQADPTAARGSRQPPVGQEPARWGKAEGFGGQGWFG